MYVCFRSSLSTVLCFCEPQDLERRYMTLKESCEDMRKETIQLRQEVRTLAENVETQQKHTDKERCELDELRNLIVVNEVSKNISITMHLSLALYCIHLLH